MKKVKIIKASSSFSYDYDSAIITPVSSDWEEVSQPEADKIREAVSYANASNKHGIDVYIYLEYSEDLKK